MVWSRDTFDYNSLLYVYVIPFGKVVVKLNSECLHRKSLLGSAVVCEQWSRDTSDYNLLFTLRLRGSCCPCAKVVSIQNVASPRPVPDATQRDGRGGATQ